MVAVLAALAIMAPTAETKNCQKRFEAKHTQAFASKVWDTRRWARGKPPKRMQRLYQHKLLHCAVSRKHRKVSRRVWKLKAKRYAQHRRCHMADEYSGRVSWFSDGITASGISAASNAGLALNIQPGTDYGYNNSTTQEWIAEQQLFLVEVNGHRAFMPVIDAGPAGWTGRMIDISGPGVDLLGISRGSFPTDAVGSVKLVLPGCEKVL